MQRRSRYAREQQAVLMCVAVPDGSGAFICRDHPAMALLAERADDVFHGGTPKDCLARSGKLGQFIPESSKSGAAAAAVYVTHKVLRWIMSTSAAACSLRLALPASSHESDIAGAGGMECGSTTPEQGKFR